MQKIFDVVVARLKALQGAESVSAFARRLKIPQNTLDCYMRGVRKPSVELITRVCETCGASADWLLGLSDIRSAADALAPSSVPTAKTVPMQKVFTPKSSTREVDLLAEVRKLKARVKALEDSSDHRSFACG